MVGFAPRRPDVFHAPESPDPAGDRSIHTPAATAAADNSRPPDTSSSRPASRPDPSSVPSPVPGRAPYLFHDEQGPSASTNGSGFRARRSDGEIAGRSADNARHTPERCAVIWCSHATSTPNRDATRTARSGWSAGAIAAIPHAATAAPCWKSMLAGPKTSPGSSSAGSSSSNPSSFTASSDSAADHTPPAADTRSTSHDHAAPSSDHGPPSPGAGQNSWRYSPEPRQITGVIDRSIAVTPTTALPDRASRPTLAPSGSGVRCPRRPRRLRRTPPHQPRTNQSGQTNPTKPTRHVPLTFRPGELESERPTRSRRDCPPRLRSPDPRTSLSRSPPDSICRSLTGPGNPCRVAFHSSTELPTSDQISCHKFGRR